MQEKIKKNANHRAELIKINRTIGQLEGIKKMIEDDRYCVDILMQVKAARSVVKNIELSILERHMQMCLAKAVASGKQDEIATKIAEITSLVKNFG